MLFIGYVAYSTGHRFFKPIGSSEFGSKIAAQSTLIILVFITGFVGDPVLAAVRNGTTGWTLIQQLGIVLIVSRVATNGLIPEWTHTDAESLVMYGVGGLAFGYPWILSLIINPSIVVE